MIETTYLSGVTQVRAYRILQFYVSKEVKKYGLNPSQWFILGHLFEQKQSRPADLADLLKVEAPLVTNLTDDLVKKGLIKKSPDKLDGRVKLLALSAKGTQLVPQIEDRLQVLLGRFLDGISPADMQTYKKVLQTIIDNSGSIS